MKLITLKGKDFIIENDGKNWYARIGGCLIIMPTIKEIKKHLLIEMQSTALYKTSTR